MKSNPNTRKLVEEKKKLSLEKKAPFWKRIAKELEKPSRNKREVKANESRQKTYRIQQEEDG